eukprot:403340181
MTQTPTQQPTVDIGDGVQLGDKGGAVVQESSSSSTIIAIAIIIPLIVIGASIGIGYCIWKKKRVRATTVNNESSQFIAQPSSSPINQVDSTRKLDGPNDDDKHNGSFQDDKFLKKNKGNSLDESKEKRLHFPLVDSQSNNNKSHEDSIVDGRINDIERQNSTLDPKSNHQVPHTQDHSASSVKNQQSLSGQAQAIPQYYPLFAPPQGPTKIYPQDGMNMVQDFNQNQNQFMNQPVSFNNTSSFLPDINQNKLDPNQIQNMVSQFQYMQQMLAQNPQIANGLPQAMMSNGFNQVNPNGYNYQHLGNMDVSNQQMSQQPQTQQNQSQTFQSQNSMPSHRPLNQQQFIQHTQPLIEYQFEDPQSKVFQEGNQLNFRQEPVQQQPINDEIPELVLNDEIGNVVVQPPAKVDQNKQSYNNNFMQANILEEKQSLLNQSKSSKGAMDLSGISSIQNKQDDIGGMRATDQSQINMSNNQDIGGMPQNYEHNIGALGAGFRPSTSIVNQNNSAQQEEDKSNVMLKAMSNTGMPLNHGNSMKAGADEQFPNMSPPKFNNMFAPSDGIDMANSNMDGSLNAAKKAKKKKKKKGVPKPNNDINNNPQGRIQDILDLDGDTEEKLNISEEDDYDFSGAKMEFL